jgi:predicted nucleotidyltransferase
MTNTLLNLQKELPEISTEVLRLVFTTATELNITAFIVGATARDIILNHIYKIDIDRATSDIDFGVAVNNWNEYQLLKKTLIESKGFQIDEEGQEQRLWYKSTKIDLVPYGGLADPESEIAFPPKDEFVMNTSGFTEAYQNAYAVQLTDNLIVHVASLAGLALLKLVAYNDRPAERRDDLKDIWFLIRNYIDAGNFDRLFSEDASDGDLAVEDFDNEKTGARLLGRDIAPLLTNQSQNIILEILSEEKPKLGVYKFDDFAIAGENFRTEYEIAIEILHELRKGITERSLI